MGVSLENAVTASNPPGAARTMSSSVRPVTAAVSTTTRPPTPTTELQMSLPRWPSGRAGGTWELFGVARFFETPRLPDNRSAPYNNTQSPAPASALAHLRQHPRLFNKTLSIGLKGLYGDGTGRYGNAQIGDLTFKSDGTMSLLHTFPGLATVEANPTKKLSIYLNYGGEYAPRRSHDRARHLRVRRVQRGHERVAIPRRLQQAADRRPAPATAKPTSDIQEPVPATATASTTQPQVGRLRYGLNTATSSATCGRATTSRPPAPSPDPRTARAVDPMVFVSMRYYIPWPGASAAES